MNRFAAARMSGTRSDFAIGRMPPETPMAMPIQDFTALPQCPLASSSTPSLVARRALVVLLALLPAIFAAHALYGAIGRDGLTAWEGLYLALFLPLFAWIAFGFATSLVGFLLLAMNAGQPRRELPPVGPLSSRTAILMPICNEDVVGLFGRLSMMERSLAQIAGSQDFAFFILSDSSAENGAGEERLFDELRGSFTLPVYYRRRTQNIARKPGNIADWVRRWGGGYDHMIVLDADSLMSGQTMARLAVEMERHPQVGLIQTIPEVVGAATLFARWQQFANRLYGPVASAGMIWWAGSEGMFWGHNGIVRVSAFASSCGLPELPGRAPFGGHIMSHDMLEAALLRRRGWHVHMVLVEDSFEEFPPSLPDLATRDRRWCQGNIQHVPLLARIRGLHPVSRFQLLVGASAYITSPMWLALILVVVGGGWAGWWAADNVLPAGGLIVLTVAMLFGPKFMALAHALSNPVQRADFGGAARLSGGVAVDIVLSILMAPIAMVTQTVNLVTILMGRKSNWNGQTRDRDGVDLWAAARLCRYHLMLGALLAVGAWQAGVSPWLIAPIIAGLMLSPLFMALTARKDWGMAASRRGLFQAPDPWWRTPHYEPLRHRWVQIEPDQVLAAPATERGWRLIRNRARR